VVHLLGGTASFVGARIIGRRYENKGTIIKDPTLIKGYEEILKRYPED